MTNKEVAAPFGELAKLLEYQGENPFKIRSYGKAYDVLRKRAEPVAALDLTELQAIEGIGKAISQKIREFVETGQLDLLTRVKAEVPQVAATLLSVRGIGPKKVRQLVTELEVDSVGELLHAIRENRVAELKGYSDKSQAKLRAQLEFWERSQGQARYAEVEAYALATLNSLRENATRAELSGPFRRQAQVIRELHFVVSEPSDTWLAAHEFVALETTGESIRSAATQRYRSDAGEFPLALWAVPDELFGAYWLLDTGSPDWLETRPALTRLCEAAREPTDEAALFAAAGVVHCPPPEREVESPSPPTPAAELLQPGDIRGVVHAHTTASDGSASLPELVAACRARGFGYLTVTDHSQAAGYARGLSPQRLAAQGREIDELQATLTDFRIFKGTECDILRDGSLDFTDEVLAALDIVIASVHSVLTMSERDATDRLLRAIHNPYTTMLGHPTARILLSRAGYPLAMHEVLDACAEQGVAIEINASPYRLDLDWRYVGMAVERGIMISINPDAHSTAGLDDVRFGVLTAQKAGLRPENCLNALGADAFGAWLAQQRRRRTA